MWKKDVKRGLAITLSFMLAISVFQGHIWDARADRSEDMTMVSDNSAGNSADVETVNDTDVMTVEGSLAEISAEKESIPETSTERESTQAEQPEEEIAAEQATEGIEITNFDMRTRENPSAPWQTVTPGMMLKDGAELSIVLAWRLDNTSNAKQYEIDFGDDAKNLQLANFDWKIHNEKGKNVARYKIEGNKFILEITDAEYQNTHSGRSGGFTMEGNVKITDGAKNYNDPYDVGLNTNLIKVRYDDGTPESDASVSKMPDGKVFKDTDGNYYQNYRVVITAQNGEVKNLVLEDKPGSGLSGMSAITIDNNGDMGLAASYASINDLNAALAGKNMAKDKSLIFTYRMKVDPDVYKKNPTLQYNNEMQLSYKSSHDIAKGPVSGWANVQADKPYVGKSGTVTGTDVNWKLVIRLDSEGHDPAKTTSDELKTELTARIAAFQDEIPAGCTVKAVDMADMTASYSANGEYVLTYTTSIDPAYSGKATQTKIENKVSFQYKGDIYDTTGVVYTGGTNWLHKTFVEDSYQASSRTVQWNVRVDIPTEDITSVKLKDEQGGMDIDWSKQQGAHHVQDITYNGKKIVENGVLVVGNEVADRYNEYEDHALQIKDSFIKEHKGQSVDFVITSKLDDEPASNVIFHNHAYLTYEADGSTGSMDDYAKWDNTSRMEKAGAAVSGESAIRYTVGVDLKDVAEVVGSAVVLPMQTVEITDVYDSSMEIVNGSIEGRLYTGWGSDPITINPADISIDTTSHKLTVKYTITAADNTKLAMYGADIKENPYSKIKLEISYKAKIKDELQFIRDGLQKTVVNRAEGKIGSTDLGSAKTENVLEPGKVIEKTGSYTGNADKDNDEETRRTVNYTVKVNPKRLDLDPASDKIELEDTLSADGKLTHDITSVKIVKVLEGGGKVTLSPSDYRIRKGATDNQIIFVVPDSTSLEITYNARISDKAYNSGESFTADNAVRIRAIGEVAGGDNAAVNLVDFRGSDWITSENYSLDLYKCWSNNVLTALPGAEFKLVQMKYEGGVLTEDTTGIHKTIQITDDSAVSRISGLTADTVFALIETKAPNGYALDTTPYYFIKEMTTARDYSPYTVHRFDAGHMITYTDEEAAALKITKEVIGGTTFDEIKAGMTFVVKEGGNVVYTIAASDMTKEPGGGYSYTVKDIKPGSYTVEEVVSGSVVPVTVKHRINEGAPQSGKVTGAVTLVGKKTTEVAFTNQYDGDVELGSIRVEKKLAAPLPTGLSEEAALKNLSFAITKVGETAPSYTVLGTQLVYDTAKKVYYREIYNVPVGNYQVEEKLTGISGYSVSTSYQVVGTATAGVGLGPAAFAVAKDTVTQLAYTNTYTQDKGKIKLEKKWWVGTGLTLTWGDIAPKLSFSIYDEKGRLIDTVAGTSMTGSTSSTEDGKTYQVMTSGEIELPIGSYYVVENNALIENTAVDVIISAISNEAAGVTKNGEVSNTFLLNKDVSVKVVYKNDYKAGKKVVISKKNIAGTDELAGAQLSVYKGSSKEDIKNENLISTWISGETAREINLADGAYILVETTAPKGYAKSELVKFRLTGGVLSGDDGAIDATDATKPTVTMKDKEFSVDVNKLNLGGYEVTGAVIRIFEDGASCLDANGNIIDEALADSQSLNTWISEIGLHNFGRVLTVGKAYWLVETSAPEGYAYMESEKFMVNEDGTITELSTGTSNSVSPGNPTATKVQNSIILRDQAIRVKLNKVDLGGQEVAGAKIALYEVNGTTVRADGTVAATATPVETWVSKAGETKDFGPAVKAGKLYVLKETIVPIGYQVAENIVFEVKKDGSVVANPGVEVTADGTIMMKDAEILPTIEITKTIEGEVTKEEAEGALQFTVTDTDKNSVFGTYTLKDGVYDASTGTWKITIKNVPKGSYTVTESISDIEGYTLTRVSYKLNGAAAETEGASSGTFTVDRGDVATVDYKDSYQSDTGKLVITKTIKGAVTKEEAEGALQFKVTENKTGKSTVYKLTDFTYNATTGNYILELTEKVGGYTVEETVYDIKGFAIETVKYSVNGAAQQTGSKAEVTVKKDATANVVFEDTYTKNPGKLVITKTIKGDVTKEEAEGALKFTVTNNDTGISQKYKLKDFKYDKKKKVWTLTLDAAAGGYTVEETVSDVKGYELTKVRYTTGGKTKNGDTAKVTVTSGEKTTVAYEDTYKKGPDHGKLRLTKTIAGYTAGKKPDDHIVFTVTNQKTGESERYKLSTFTYDEESGTYYRNLELEVGTYVVKEKATGFSGVELVKVTVAVNGGEEQENNVCEVKVVKDKTAKAAYTNTYGKKETSTATPAPPTTDTSKTTTETSSKTSTKTGLTKTGDDAPIGLWLLLLLGGGLGIAGSLIMLRKRKTDKGES